MPEVGFEPTHPKITELKSAALDHSAIQAYLLYMIIIYMMKLEGLEPPVFGSGIRRATNYAIASYDDIIIIYTYK